MGSSYCAFVAVTTATEVGVATPVTAAGGGFDGGGLLPDGGGVDAPPPPHADSDTTMAISIMPIRTSRERRAITEMLEWFNLPPTGASLDSSCVGGEVLPLEA